MLGRLVGANRYIWFTHVDVLKSYLRPFISAIKRYTLVPNKSWIRAKI